MFFFSLAVEIIHTTCSKVVDPGFPRRGRGQPSISPIFPESRIEMRKTTLFRKKVQKQMVAERISKIPHQHTIHWHLNNNGGVLKSGV